MSIKFGTDGWRAVIADEFTFANVERVSQATADYWSANPVAGTERKVIVGYDRRFLSDKFAQRAAEVFAGNSFQVVRSLAALALPSQREQSYVGLCACCMAALDVLSYMKEE